MNDRMPDRDDVIARLEAVAEYHERRARELSAFDAAQTTEAMANEQEGMSVLADAARDALTLLRETWRGMDTAPRDGTRILIAWDGIVVTGNWLDNSASPVCPWAGWRPEILQAVRGKPSGWRPLPPLPKEGDNG